MCELTENEVNMLLFINDWRKTSRVVLEKTFYDGIPKSKVKRRIEYLCEKKMLESKISGNKEIKTVYTIGEDGAIFLEEAERQEVRRYTPPGAAIFHLTVEQIAWYWLVKTWMGKAIWRTSVYHNNSREIKFRHVPDFKVGRKINIEIELSKKSSNRYKEILEKTKKDGVETLIYICKNRGFCEDLARFMPADDRLFLIDIDTLVLHIKETGKPFFFSQKALLSGAENPSVFEEKIEQKIDKSNEESASEIEGKKERERIQKMMDEFVF